MELRLERTGQFLLSEILRPLMTLNDQAVCGVPLMSPLEELIVKLAGRPLAVHVRPPVPPEPVIGWE